MPVSIANARLTVETFKKAMELSMDCIISGTYYSMGVDSLPAAL